MKIKLLNPAQRKRAKRYPQPFFALISCQSDGALIGSEKKQGRSPIAMLQQNKRDDARLFLLKRNHHFHFAPTRSTSSL